MKRVFLFTICFCLLSVAIFAQTKKEARQIDEFVFFITCGDFSARMDNIFANLQNSPDSKVYVIYYGGRYRKKRVWNAKTKSYDVSNLKYPHREDGLNVAKSIPLYLTKSVNFSMEQHNLFKNKVVLVDGGFRENIEVEIWLVPKDAELPKPISTIDEKYIKFRKDKPYPTPDFANGCY